MTQNMLDASALWRHHPVGELPQFFLAADQPLAIDKHRVFMRNVGLRWDRYLGDDFQAARILVYPGTQVGKVFFF